MDLAHLGHRRRGRGRALAQPALRRGRLDVDDDVGVAERARDELLDRVGGRVRLADALVGRDADDEVGEVAAGGVADAHAAQLDRLAQARPSAARMRSSASAEVRSISTCDRLPREPQRERRSTSAATSSAGDRVGVRRARPRRGSCPTSTASEPARSDAKWTAFAASAGEP